jgi:hypothetical protein
MSEAENYEMFYYRKNSKQINATFLQLGYSLLQVQTFFVVVEYFNLKVAFIQKVLMHLSFPQT